MDHETLTVEKTEIPLTWVHTLVIGSGAAGLNAAVQLRANGVEDVLIVSEGLDKGTSINTGSDKQTYYKLSMYGADADAPREMAQTYYVGGGMHGDLAMVEASLSARAFMHLVNLGMPFPRDAYGQFVGYKTDHDPRQRATSIGPYTSQAMCHVLIQRVRELEISVREGRNVVQLLTCEQDGETRVCGALAVCADGSFEAYGAENVVFAVGGPGGLYKTSVYPTVHTGAIGLALLAGARAQGLPESQYGLASIGYRWNVSGTYMQVIPRIVSTAQDGMSDEREFLTEFFGSTGAMASQVFLKGYQWPFDARKVIGGSSLIDILIYIETVEKGRRVYLDYRRDPAGFAFADLSEEARSYLERSGALLDTPYDRLRKMNPGATELYLRNGIDLTQEPLEVAVCAQHNNGGLAANHWWESSNLRHLFPVGEVNGSHGVYRPGGSALNSGQVGGFRAAEYIAHRCQAWQVSREAVRRAAQDAVGETTAWLSRCEGSRISWRDERAALQERMTRAGAHIRSLDVLPAAQQEARAQWRRLEQQGCAYAGPAEIAEALRNRQLCFAHLCYLEAIRCALESGVGSRGSAIVLDPGGERIHEGLDAKWSIAREVPRFRLQVLETVASPSGDVTCRWVDRRPLPRTEAWFETEWARFRQGETYDPLPAQEQVAAKLCVGTANAGKQREFVDLLRGWPGQIVFPQDLGLDLDVEETGQSFAEIAVHKALAYAQASGLPALADDSGLCVDALDGAPGIYTARYAGPGASDVDRYRKLLAALGDCPLEERTARFRCALAIAYPDGRVDVVEGTCEGQIAFEPAGSEGFGYDPVFYLPEYGCTMAQLPADVKNQISHRARAVQAAASTLDALLVEV